MKKLFILVFAGIVLLFNACQTNQNEKSMAINLNDMDTTVHPGDNFYEYANGGWIKNHPLPEDKSRFGTFDELQENNNKLVRHLIEKLSESKNEAGSVAEKIGDFYGVGMDTAIIEEQGLTPLKKEFEKIESIQSLEDVQAEVARMHSMSIYPLFIIFSNVDGRNSKMVIAQMWQGGLGMTDRDYYVKDDSRSKEIRVAYLDHLNKMFGLMGDSPDKSGKEAQTIMDIETRLAKASRTRLENRDPVKTYNKLDMDSLKKLAPTFDWESYFDQIEVPDPGKINVSQPEFIKEVSNLLISVPVDNWKIYLKWNLINDAASYLNNAFVDQNFAFYGKALSGTEVIRPRWKRVISATNGALGEAIGRMFVKEYFPPESKERMLKLVGNLKISLGNRIKNLDWMSDDTKKNALEKLEAINVKIGYPDKWRDYSGLEISKDSYVMNALKANRFNFAYMMKKVNKPTDPNDWGMTPQTVNAYYNPTRNEIVFPAGILQPPFFFKDGDDAVNYGAIGVVIGHEMTHGFDDQGRLFGKDGNLNEWWTKEDSKLFKERADGLVKEFDSFVVLDDTVHANGGLTLGENIADLGGLNVSYDAFKSATSGQELQKIDGFTPDQRFYLAYAHVWAQNIRNKEILRRTKEDVHSLGKFRVNGPLPNLEAFLDAFGITQNDPMFIPPEKRVKIW